MKIGDKAVVVENNSGHEFELGSKVECVDVCLDGAHLFSDGTNEWYMGTTDYKIGEETDPDEPLNIDIPTASMKEFADHCERAAAALERIKEMMKC